MCLQANHSKLSIRTSTKKDSAKSLHWFGQLELLTLEALIEEPEISQNPALELTSKNICCHFHFQDHVRFNEEGDFLCKCAYQLIRTSTKKDSAKPLH